MWGSRVPMAALRHLLGDPAFDARALVEHFLLRPDGDDLAFSHALIRDGAYGSLLHARRRELHLAAAQWIEADDVALAAEHYERAHDERAAQAYLRASEALTENSSTPRHWRWSSAACRWPTRRRAVQAAAGARQACSWRTPRRRVHRAGRAALEVAQSGADRALALIEIVPGMRLLDRHAEGLALLEEAQPLAEHAGIAAGIVAPAPPSRQSSVCHGPRHRMPTAHERALEFARQAASVDAQVEAMGGIGDALYAQGRIRTAHHAFTHCVTLARAHRLLRVEVAYLTMVGGTLAVSRWTSSAALPARPLASSWAALFALAGRNDMRVQRVVVDGWFLRQCRGRPAACGAHARNCPLVGNPRTEALYWTGCAMLALREGDRNAACSHAERALEFAGENDLELPRRALIGRVGPRRARRRLHAGRRWPAAKKPSSRHADPQPFHFLRTGDRRLARRQ